MKLIDELQDLALSPSEAEIYLALLREGMGQPGSIAKQTNRHRQTVYSALDTLVELGLATVMMREGGKTYSASSPYELVRRVEKRRLLLEGTKAALVELQSVSSNPADVRVLYGKKGYLENLEMLMQSAVHSDKIERIVGGADGDFFWNILGSDFERYQARLNEHKIRKHMIGSDGYSKEGLADFLLYDGYELRLIPYAQAPSTFTRITLDMVSIEILNPEVVIIQMLGEQVAQLYLESFNSLWSVLPELYRYNREKGVVEMLKLDAAMRKRPSKKH